MVKIYEVYDEAGNARHYPTLLEAQRVAGATNNNIDLLIFPGVAEYGGARRMYSDLLNGRWRLVERRSVQRVFRRVFRREVGNAVLRNL